MQGAREPFQDFRRERARSSCSSELQWPFAATVATTVTVVVASPNPRNGHSATLAVWPLMIHSSGGTTSLLPRAVVGVDCCLVLADPQVRQSVSQLVSDEAVASTTGFITCPLWRYGLADIGQPPSCSG